MNLPGAALLLLLASFRFAILGDRTGQADPEVYERAWSQIDRLHPAFVINAGDTIQGGADARAEDEWRELRPLWSRYRQYPFYFTPGNHDIWSEASRRIFEKETGRPAYYGFNYQDAHFTVLDNSQTLDLSEQQLDFLEKDLAANARKSSKFIFFHKPFWILFLKLGSGEFRLHQLAAKYHVTAVISGHGHRYLHLERDGIGYLEVGSSGGHLRGDSFDEGWFYQFAWVQVTGSRAEFTVQEIGRARRSIRITAPSHAAP